MRVEVWSDVVCPWCYVGSRRFDEAIERLADEIDIEVVYRAFELDPSVPPGGLPLTEYLRRKFGPHASLERIEGRVGQAGAEVDIDFRWDGMRRANTFDAHRLLAWALDTSGPKGQIRLQRRLFRAYFTDGLDVGDRGVLTRLAGEAGLDADLATEALSTGQASDSVRAEERRAAELGIHAVPTFVIEGQWAIPGAQDPGTFVQLLRRAAERLTPPSVGAAGAESDAEADGSADGACAI